MRHRVLLDWVSLTQEIGVGDVGKMAVVGPVEMKPLSRDGPKKILLLLFDSF